MPRERKKLDQGEAEMCRYCIRDWNIGEDCMCGCVPSNGYCFKCSHEISPDYLGNWTHREGAPSLSKKFRRSEPIKLNKKKEKAMKVGDRASALFAALKKFRRDSPEAKEWTDDTMIALRYIMTGRKLEWDQPTLLKIFAEGEGGH